MKRFIKRLRELRYRIDNFAYFRRRGLSISRAWAKADITLPPTKTATPWR